MDALDLLTADHQRVRGLFHRFNAARKGDEGDAIELAGQIAEEVAVHTAIEEEVFYPALRGAGGALDELVDESLQEHHVVKVLLEELDGTEAGGDEWSAKLSVIIENVEHHAEEEEQELFPKVRQAMGREALEELAARLDAAKGQLGAPTERDRAQLSPAEVRSLASKQQIPGRSSLPADKLRAAIDPRAAAS